MAGDGILISGGVWISQSELVIHPLATHSMKDTAIGMFVPDMTSVTGSDLVKQKYHWYGTSIP